MNDCIFCKIAAGELPSTKVYEDDEVLAFMDIAPTNLGHVLVVPKKHSDSINDMTEDEVATFYARARRIAPAVRDGVGAGGYNLYMNVGAIAGQVVFHTHVHIIPRTENDGLKLWPKRELSTEEIMAPADAIRERLAS